MEHLNKLINLLPFGYDHIEREKIFTKAMYSSFDHHIKNCIEFREWCLKFNIRSSKDLKNINDIPFFPNLIFKKLNLVSTKNNYKTILSSGTSNQQKSKIFIDIDNARRQKIVLAKILNNLLGKHRKPYLIADLDPNITKKSNDISARVAGMTGYLIGSSSKEYFLKESNVEIKLDVKKFTNLIEKYNNEKKPLVLIGYTFMVYEKLLLFLKENKIKIKLPKNSYLIHFGGWKKLKNKKINKKILTKLINETLNISQKNVIDIYGFTEQLGTVYPSLGLKNNRVPAYSKVLIRDTKTLEIVKDGKIGFIQFLSPLPTSYPGISILNDDIGRITKNKGNEIEFEILERLDKSEQRGCGDTLPKNYFI